MIVDRVLAYGIVDADAEIEPPSAVGLRGRPVEHVIESRLRGFYSEAPAGLESGRVTAEDVLAFDRVVRSLFRAATVIPFRFPSLLDDPDALCVVLRTRATRYREALSRLHGRVQMEVRVWGPQSARPASGREYLRSRRAERDALQGAMAIADRAAAELVHARRNRETGRGARWFALVDRDAVDAFRERIRSAAFDDRLRITVSGPWPPSAFVGDPRD